MKLVELKKLKVSELRSRLEAAGLSSRGLKAELVSRLWSASQAGPEDSTETQPPKDKSRPEDSTETQPPKDKSRPEDSTETQPPKDKSRPEDSTETQPPKDKSRPEDSTETQPPKDKSRPEDSTETQPPKDKSRPEDSTETQPPKDKSRPEDSTETQPPKDNSTRPEAPMENLEPLTVSSGGFSDVSTQTDFDQPEEVEKERRPLSSEEVGRGRAFYEFKEEIRYKRAKLPQPPPEGAEVEKEDDDKVRIDPYCSHLHFEVGPDGTSGQPRFWDRFPLLWSGCRLTHGVLQGRVGFEVRLEKKLLMTQLEGKSEDHSTEPYGLRVGWSLADTSLLLGADEFSYAYVECGKKVSGGREDDFGEPFSEGDIIGCYASFSVDGTVELSFRTNGHFMGVAFVLDSSVLQGRALFPHAFCRSCSIRFLLDPTAPPWYPSPPGFTPLAALPSKERLRATLAPSSKLQCEVVLMVGFPGCGKSHWAKAYMEQQQEKHFKLLGTEELLRCMMSGGQMDTRLQQATQCLSNLIKLAADKPGNYILDQCNILFSARRYKLHLFAGFRRRVVVVFPSADEWKKRLSQHQERDEKKIPETALLKLQVSCSLPEQQSDLLEELQYVELPQDQAQVLLQEYREEARRLLPPTQKQEKKPRLHKKRPHPHGPLPSRWKDTRLNLQSWSQQPGYWNVAYPDQSYYYSSEYEGYC
ncbi:heterogeneous nuclear ribonucleoprotein U-like protein 2 isoform X2 [Thalassophryne amazonica]|uniref:heterogeneous nuclear ribonucleoprotein U-like protein 2 isoform X2 n=1 Tax=Thalassophryne amazonica TaxID=390379 RepID=UPI00147233F5|nr:heterogeneous nuclear ribonucleoprotein U-like protein 2 isoform X2 [Thalassophryne amazonica]